MSRIDLQHPHTLAPGQARDAVQHIADALRTRFDCACHRQGDCLAFKRAGVDGEIALAPGQVRVTARLGFPVSLMQARIESEIRRVLHEKFRAYPDEDGGRCSG